ncbi:glycosyltransferase family 39 protein [Luteipulveratus mongoliensis]|uniref:glycosyltransferase family 39 protein n=1 Tax=Luteipulveratus mongoliensis TaxID=571913 RepID=UPI0012EE202D
MSTVGSWLDEGATMSAAQRSPSGILALSRHHDAVLGTYYALVHSWMSVVGQSLTSARALSALCLAAATVAIVDCGRAVGGTAVGCVAGVQMLIVPGVGWSGFDARPTAVSVLLLSIALRVLIHARGSVPSSWFYALMAVAGWVQLTTILQLLTTFRRSTLRSWRLWVSVLVVGVCVLPVAWKGHQQSAQISWIHDGVPAQLASVFVGRFADSPKSTTQLTQLTSVTSALVGISYVALCVFGLVVLKSSTARLLVSWAFGPAVLAVIAGAVTGGTVYLPRYFAASLPAAFILVALVARRAWSTSSPTRAVAAISAVVIAAICAPSLIAARVDDGKWGENSNQVAQEVRARQAPVIWMGNSLSVPLTYPHVVQGRAQYPSPSSAYSSDSLWGSTPNPRAAIAATGRWGHATVLVENRNSVTLQRAFTAAGCATADDRQYQRYTLFTATC